MMTLAEMFERYGEDVVVRWAETGRLAEEVLPRFAEHGHGNLAHMGGKINPWCVHWATFEHWEGQRGGCKFVTETLEGSEERRGATALDALMAANV
jgi:hypothetical protein